MFVSLGWQLVSGVVGGGSIKLVMYYLGAVCPVATSTPHSYLLVFSGICQ